MHHVFAAHSQTIVKFFGQISGGTCFHSWNRYLRYYHSILKERLTEQNKSQVWTLDTEACEGKPSWTPVAFDVMSSVQLNTSIINHFVHRFYFRRSYYPE